METVREFGIQPILILAQVVNFLLLVVLLRRFLYKPVVTMLEERKARIAQSMQQAEEIERRLTATRAEQEHMLAQARAQTQKIINEAKEASTLLMAKAHAEAKQTTSRMIDSAKAEIEQDRLTMRDDLRKELARLVIHATEKVLGRVVSQADQKRLIARTVDEVSHG